MLHQDNELASCYDDILVNYLLASEFEGFGALDSGSGARGSTITGVRYEEAQKGSIEFVADGQEYDGRFPLGIAIGVSAEVKGNLLVDVEAAYLVGPNTIGSLFLQTNSLWKDDPYDGSSTITIGTLGCALSCIAMILKAHGADINPGELNAWMKERKKFDGLGAKWETLRDYANSPFKEVDVSGTGLLKDMVSGKWNIPPPSLPSLINMDAALASGLPVIAQVLNPKTNNNHWVVITGKNSTGSYTILDPGGGDQVLIGQSQNYKTIYRYVRLTPR